MAISLGNDVSKYQGDIDFELYKNNSNFLICKATEGVGYTDPKFVRNQSEARRVGLPLGYYHFARPDLGNTAIAEADWFLKTIGTLQEGEVCVLDYECANQVQSHVVWCRDFLNRVFEKIGVRPFIYLNQSQVTKFDWQVVIDGNYALWIAAYTKDPTNNIFTLGKFPSAAMQQWTNAQTVPGIAGGVDGNVFFGDITTFKKYGYVPPVPTPVDTTDYKALYEKVINESQTKLLEMAQTYEKEKATLTTQISALETALRTLQDTEHTWEMEADDKQRKLKAIVELFASVDVSIAVESDISVLAGTIHDYIANAEANGAFVTRILSDTSLGSPEAVVDAIERLRISETTITELEKQITKLQNTINTLKIKQPTLWQFIINKYFTK